jgi:hypothetical protein
MLGASIMQKCVSGPSRPLREVVGGEVHEEVTLEVPVVCDVTHHWRVTHRCGAEGSLAKKVLVNLMGHRLLLLGASLQLESYHPAHYSCCF